MTIKYALYRYDTYNLGDEIQSIAAKRFLPGVDYYINRDNINDVAFEDGDTVKLIMNAWYLQSSNGALHWPPKSQQLDPLLISMFVQHDFKHYPEGKQVEKLFLSKASREFLSKYGPVGARDEGTLEFFRKNNIDSYFSGCLTLTLLPDSRVKKQSYILAVDVSQEILEFLKSKTEREVITIDTSRSSKLTTDEKMIFSRYWLMLYQSAHCVVTTRLHAMLPCLAFGTPVLAIEKSDDEDLKRRFAGLLDLTNHTSQNALLRGSYQYDIESPPANPALFKKLKSDLETKCKEYTGYDSQTSYLGDLDPNELMYQPEFISAISKLAQDSVLYEEQGKELLRLNEEKAQLLAQNKAQNSYIDELKTPGIKQSLGYLGEAVARRIKRQFKR